MAGRPKLAPYPSLEEVLEAVAFAKGPVRVGQVWRLLLARAEQNETPRPSRDGTATRIYELTGRGNLHRHGKRGGACYVLADAVLNPDAEEPCKVCIGCGEDKPYSHFSGGGRPTSPLRPRCRACERKMNTVKTSSRCECGEWVLEPGPCGFCREEEAGERLTALPVPDPLTPAENRSTLARERAGRALYDVASNLG